MPMRIVATSGPKHGLRLGGHPGSHIPTLAIRHEGGGSHEIRNADLSGAHAHGARIRSLEGAAGSGTEADLRRLRGGDQITGRDAGTAAGTSQSIADRSGAGRTTG